MQGYDVELAGDGEEALLKLRANPSATDLLIVDVLMPRLDGLEMTRRLRADGSELPILMLTARDQVADRVAGLEAGADDYLVKPFALEELVARVRALLRRLGADETATTLAFADLELNTGTREVTRGDESLVADAHRVRAARALPAQPEAGADPLGDLRPRLGLRLRLRLELARRLHQLPAQEDRSRRQAAPDPHGARRRLRPARAMSLRARLVLVAAAAVAVAVVLASVVVYFLVSSELRGQVEPRASQAEVEQVATAPGLPFTARISGTDQYVVHVRPLTSGGYFQLVDTDGRRLPPGAGGLRLPARCRAPARARAVAAGKRGPLLLGRRLAGRHLRIYTARARPGPGRRDRVATRSANVDHELAKIRLWLVLVALGGVGIASRRRLPRRARDAEAGARPERGGRAGAHDARPDRSGSTSRAATS